MANYICIDGGTTNTRVNLVCERKLIDSMKFNVGARSGIDNKSLLRTTIRDGIAQLLSRNSMDKADIAMILASGMITSEFGLVELPHALLPAGMDEMHASMHKVVLDDISDIPFVFMRGVKTSADTLESADMMRGEETELMGLYSEEGVYILPGSHSKIIKTNAKGQIVDFTTMLTGEMFSALSQGTILKDAVILSDFEVDKESLMQGYQYCLKNGINEAPFKARILKNIFKQEPAVIYNFYMGVILCGEVKYVLAQDPPKIVIGGKRQFKQSLAVILRELTSAVVVEIPEDEVDASSCLGMIRIFEHS